MSNDIFGVNAVVDERVHDVVAAADARGQRRNARPDDQSCALPIHTSVPWDRPEMRISSSIVVGLRLLQHAGGRTACRIRARRSVPVLAADLLRRHAQRLRTGEQRDDHRPGRCSGMACGRQCPSSPCSMRIMVGSSWPRTSSFTSTSCIEPKSIVRRDDRAGHGHSAGCWMATNC